MKILVFGGSGLVGSKFISQWGQNFEIKAPSATEVDILEKDAISNFVQEFNPDTIINFAAYTQVEEAESQKEDKNGLCFLLNAIGAKNVAEVCKDFNKKLIHISTDYVFNGEKENSPYTEEDQPDPINWYGQTKYLGEQSVIQSGCPSIIVRISMPYTGFYQLKRDIARFFLEQLKLKNQVKAVEDQWITPTFVDDIIGALKVLIESESHGLYHVSSTDSVTPLEFVKNIAEEFRLDYSLIEGISLAEFNKGKKATILKYSWLNPAKFERQFGEGILHTVEEGLILFKKEIDEQARNQL